MAIKFNAVVCPQCGANLQMEVDREQMFCSYCGTKIIATNENIGISMKQKLGRPILLGMFK